MGTPNHNEPHDYSELVRLAKLEYPIPANACVWVRKQIEWRRENWVNKKVASLSNNATKPN